MSYLNDISLKKAKVVGQGAGKQYIIAIHDPARFNYAGIYTVSISNGTDTYQFDLDITGSTSPAYNAVSCKVVNIMSSAGVGISDSLADFNANFDFNIVDDGSNRNFVTLTFKNAAFMGGNFDMSIDNKIPSGMEWTSLVDYLGKDYSAVAGSPFSDDTLLSPLAFVGGGGGSPALTTPTLTTTAASSVGMNSMVLNGTLDNLGSETSVTVKFTYSINSGAATTVNATGGASVTATGSFSYTLTGLSSGDAVTFKILAVGLTNSGNDGAGTNLSATTSSLSAPTVTTSAATSLTSNSMTLNANLTSLGSETSVNVYFNYRVQGSGSAYTSTAPVNKTATGTFTFSLTGLAANTTYEYYATAAGQTNAGNNGTSTPNSTGLTTAVVLDADSFFNITGAANTATSTALTAASVPSLTNGAITSNTVVASADNCVSQTVEIAQQGADVDWVAIKPEHKLKPLKLAIDATSNSATPVFNTTDAGVIVNGSAVWVDDGGTIKEIVLGSVVQAVNTVNVPALPAGFYSSCSAVRGGNTWVLADGTNSNKILTSLDGINWTPRTLPSSCAKESSPTWNGSLWVLTDGNLGSTKVFTSPDGVTWTLRTLPSTYTGGSSATWNGTLWVITDSTSSTKVFTSPDGVTWTLRTLPSTYWGSASAAWNGTLWVIIDNTASSNKVFTSPDGVTWTLRTLPSTYSGAGSATWNGTLWVITDSTASSTKVFTSPDGVTWTLRTLPSTYTNQVVYGSAAWNGTLWVIIDNTASSNKVFTSPDGVTWTLRTLPSTYSGAGSATWNGTLWVITDSTSSTKVFTSPDGVTWTLRTALGNYTAVDKPAWGDGLWIISGGFDSILVSTDAINWTVAGGAGAAGQITSGYKYTCTSISAGRIGTVPLSNNPSWSGKAGQLFQSDLYTTTGSPSFTNDTISAVTRSSDTLTITCAQRSESGANRFAAEKVTINKGDTMIQYSAGLYE